MAAAGPRNARQTSRGRVYTRHGRNYWSVTTIIKNGLPAPAIKEWAVSKVAEYAVANRAQLGAMLQAVTLRRVKPEEVFPKDVAAAVRAVLGVPYEDSDERRAHVSDPIYVVSDPDRVASVVAFLRNAPYRESERKKDLGSDIHRHVEAHILGHPVPETPPDVAPYIHQLHRVEDAFRPHWLMSEATVYSDSESYAGTLDVLARVGQRDLIAIGDVKSGKAIYSEIALQLAAYARADYVGLPDGTDVEMPRPDLAFGLHLTPDDYHVIPVRIDDDVWDAFRYTREVFRWMEETSKDVLGPELDGPESWDMGVGEVAAPKEVA
jgi:hypothetical protein